MFVLRGFTMSRRKILGDISTALRGGAFVLLSSLLISMSSLNAADSSKSSTSSNSGGSYSSGPSESENEFENYPFKKAQGSIPAEQVCGIRLKKNKMILLSYDHEYSEEQLKDDENFSDTDFFKKYPKLLSVELSEMDMSDEILENLQAYLPNDLKMLIIDSCKISKKNGYTLLSDLIERHSSLISLRVRMYSTNASQSEQIADVLSRLKKLKYLGVGFGEVDNKTLGNLAECLQQSSNNLKDLSLSWMEIANGEDKSEEDNNNNNEEDASNGANGLVEALQKVAPRLQSLELAFLKLPEKSVIDWFGSLEKCKELKNLTIYVGNMRNYVKAVRNDSAETLGTAVGGMKHLEKLDISYMNVGGDFIKPFADYLKNNPKLSILNISGNPIDVDGASTLANSLKETGALQVFMANDCAMENQTFSELIKFFDTSALTSMYLKNNKIQEGIKQVPFKNMTSLQVVDLSNNSMTGEDIAYIAENSPDNLQAVNCSGNSGLNEMSKLERQDLRDKLENLKLNGLKTAFFGI